MTPTETRELLALAAKAAGIRGMEWSAFDDRFEYSVEHKGMTNYFEWNPITDDGDALRLAVKLKIDLGFYAKESNGTSICVIYPVPEPVWCETLCEDYDKDPYAATRLAITRAAAAIGKGMK